MTWKVFPDLFHEQSQRLNKSRFADYAPNNSGGAMKLNKCWSEERNAACTENYIYIDIHSVSAVASCQSSRILAVNICLVPQNLRRYGLAYVPSEKSQTYLSASQPLWIHQRGVKAVGSC